VRQRITAILERFFPGMGLGPAALTVLSALCLTLYYHHGTPGDAPKWFIEWATELTGIEIPRFHRHGWGHLSAVVMLLTVPALAVRFGMGMGLRDLGFRLKGTGKELLIVLAMWAAFTPVIIYFSGTEAFARTYPRLPQAESDVGLFWLYQAFYLLKWMSWEFFFRGFMLFAFQRYLGAAAVLISTIPFVIMHVGKPEAEMLGAIAAGFILCGISLRSKSIWPGVVLHAGVATTMDFFASDWWR
jgi:uncharacterized protein